MVEADLGRYNVTPTAAYTYAPAYRRYGHKINAVHFIGPHKPWANIQSRPAGVSRPANQDQSYDCTYQLASVQFTNLS